MFFSLKTAMRKTETEKKITKSIDADADKIITKNKKAAAESNTETKERDKQTVIMIITKVMTAIMIEADTEMKKAVNSESKKNIRLLSVIQMMLKVLFIF